MLMLEIPATPILAWKMAYLNEINNTALAWLIVSMLV
jgi:hypothetical protein